MRNLLNRVHTIALVCIFLLVGCKRQEPVSPTVTISSKVPNKQEWPSQTIIPTVQPRQSLGQTGTNTPSPTSTVLTTPTTTLTVAVTAPPGIVYGTEALWVTQDDGKRVNLGPIHSLISPNSVIAPNQRLFYFSQSVFDATNKSTGAEDLLLEYRGEDLWVRDLINGEIINLTNNPSLQSARQYGIWSPDSRYIFYCKEEKEGGNKDIWAVEVRTGVRSNLTNTPNMDESRLRYWSGPNRLIFTARKDGEDGGPFNAGHLFTMKADGSEYQVLSKGLTYILPEVSPDEWTLVNQGGFLQRAGERIRKIDFTLVDSQYQQDEVSLISPAWSPDGRSIAWSVSVGNLVGVGVFDLEKNELRLFHQSEVYGGEGFLPAPQWSPDGKWLAWNAWSQDIDRIGVWIIRPETGQEIYLGKFQDAVWSPDSRWIAFVGMINPDANAYLDGVWIADVGNWTPQRTDLPSFTDLHAWHDPATIRHWTSFPLLWMGNFVTVTASGSPVKLHAEPGENTLVIVSIMVGQHMQVISGPVMKDGFTWWKMRTEDGTEGWSVENEEWYEVLHW